jgi:hypothetical protein
MAPVNAAVGTGPERLKAHMQLAPYKVAGKILKVRWRQVRKIIAHVRLGARIVNVFLALRRY